MKKGFYYCTCIEDKIDKNKTVIRGRTSYRLVPVCKEGICDYCGYYAVASDKVMAGRLLLNYVTREIQPIPDSVKGGLSVASTKKINKAKLTNKKINSTM